MRDVVFGEQSKQQPRAIPEQVPASRNRYARLKPIRSSRHCHQHHHRRRHRTQPSGLPRQIAVLHCAVNRKRTSLHRNQCVIQVTPPSAVAQRVPLSQATTPCCGSSKRMETMAPVSTLEFAASETLLQCSPPSVRLTARNVKGIEARLRFLSRGLGPPQFTSPAPPPHPGPHTTPAQPSLTPPTAGTPTPRPRPLPDCFSAARPHCPPSGGRAAEKQSGK